MTRVPSGRRRLRQVLRRLLLVAVTATLQRLRPLAPPTLWFSLLALRSAAGRGPVLTRPRAERVLVLAPHPDDETIGCGGCIALLADAGADVRVIAASSGEASVSDPSRSAHETTAARTRELERAAACLGATVETILPLPDGELSHHQDVITASIDVVLAEFQPTLIFVPWPLDDHPDHQAVCRALAGCAGLDQPSEIWCYEVWSALPPNRIVDVSAWWEKKTAALTEHASAAVGFDTSAHLALGRWRSITVLSGAGHAEAYLALRSPQFARLVAETL